VFFCFVPKGSVCKPLERCYKFNRYLNSVFSPRTRGRHKEGTPKCGKERQKPKQTLQINGPKRFLILSDSSNTWRNTWREKESPANGKTEAKKCSIVVIRRTQSTNQLTQRGVVQNGLRKRAYICTHISGLSLNQILL